MGRGLESRIAALEAKRPVCGAVVVAMMEKGETKTQALKRTELETGRRILTSDKLIMVRFVDAKDGRPAQCSS
jgi:hypothetical protein